MKKIIIFSNTSWSLYNFRKNLISELLKKNYKVIILSNKDRTTKKLQKMGCVFHSISLERRGVKIISEFYLLLKIYLIIRKISPDVIFNFTIKPIIYGSLVSRILKIRTLNTLDGLGASYEINIFKRGILNFMLNLSQKKVEKFFFVNSFDLNFFVNKKFVNKKKAVLINGTGIDLSFFKYKKNIIQGKIKFLLISRLLYSKGVIDYLNTAKILTKKFRRKCSFSIAGIIEKNIKDSIPVSLMNRFVKNPDIHISYNETNIKKLLYKSNCVVLPTTYNEGLPKSLLEAASVGRPIISSNVPGCLRIAKNNYNALIYDKKRPQDLVKCITKFILMKKNKKLDMSLNSCKVAKKFDDKKIILRYIRFLYEKKK